MKRLSFIALSLLSASAFAADPVLLEKPITYAPDASVVQSVKDECHIEEMLAGRIEKALSRLEKTDDVTIASDAETRGATVLRLQITHVLGVGGGAWSGPKAITLSADIVKDGKVLRHTKITRWSVGGVWGAFKGTCSILDRTTIILAKDLRRWVRDPSYEIKEEAPPKDASDPSAQTAEQDGENKSK